MSALYLKNQYPSRERSRGKTFDNQYTTFPQKLQEVFRNPAKKVSENLLKGAVKYGTLKQKGGEERWILK